MFRIFLCNIEKFQLQWREQDLIGKWNHEFSDAFLWCGWAQPYKTIAKFIVHSIAPMFLYSLIVIVVDMRGSREGTGGPTSRQITKQCFLRNSGPDPLEKLPSQYPAFNVGSKSARQRKKHTHLNGASLADFVYLEGICKFLFKKALSKLWTWTLPSPWRDFLDPRMA